MSFVCQAREEVMPAHDQHLRLVWLAKDGLNSLDQNLISLDFYKSMADSVELSFCP